MKKSGLIILLLVSQIILAQGTRFIYQVTMKPDSTNSSDVKTELAHLDITANGSSFYPENRLKRDSVFSRMRQTSNFNFDRSLMQSLRSNMDYIIDKDYKTGEKVFKSQIARDQYSYTEDRPIAWKILPEISKIGDYKTQKAETTFAGRTWHAWFSTDLPFQDGPYKFSGLPGLIVKVEDSKGDYSFDLKETKKLNEKVNFAERGATINVKRAAFLKQQEQFKKDPMAAINSSGRGGIRIQMDPNQRKQMEIRQKEEQKKNNNPIELK